MFHELIILSLLCLVAARRAEQFNESLNVKLPIFTVQGAVSDNSSSVRVFRGIPYAEPPLGDLRFRPPVTKKPVSGIIDATKYKNICPIWNQGGPSVYSEYITGDQPYSYLEQGEDCLHVNIWTPINATYHSNLTVMIWIHGGGYVFQGLYSVTVELA
jgi:carboxylesterase type B